jgi:3-deoxy-alpha-D-manno-octulosonate 8-oxidase
MMNINQIQLPQNVVAEIPIESLEKMTDVALVLEPLWENALNKNWKKLIPKEKIMELYQRM